MESHVTESLGAHDMIIGRDILDFLIIDIRFSNQMVHWGTGIMPFKDQVSTQCDGHFINEDELENVSKRIRRILDVKCKTANIDDVCSHQDQLDEGEKEKFRQLQLKCETLFHGSLGKWNGNAVELQLNKGAIPHHTRAFPVPRGHLDALKMEGECLCQL